MLLALLPSSCLLTLSPDSQKRAKQAGTSVPSACSRQTTNMSSSSVFLDLLNLSLHPTSSQVKNRLAHLPVPILNTNFVFKTLDLPRTPAAIPVDPQHHVQPIPRPAPPEQQNALDWQHLHQLLERFLFQVPHLQRIAPLRCW